MYRVNTTFMIRGQTYRKGTVITEMDLEDPAFVPVLLRAHLIVRIKETDGEEGATNGRSGDAEKLRRTGR